MLGEKIKELRERENYSQKELGLKLGVSPSTIGMYEQNRRSPGKDMLLNIAKVFNVSVDYLLSSDTYNTTSTKENHNYKDVNDILKVSEGRWQTEECFRIMKTDFSARPVYLQDENRIKAHFLICFLSLTIYRYLEKKLNLQYTCEELLNTLKAMNFAEIQEQGFIPLYKREKITDALHESCGFRTDYQFITKSKMKTIQKKSKGKE